MPLKKFLEYTEYYSKDPKTFESRIAILGKDLITIPEFRQINSLDRVEENLPVLVWNVDPLLKEQLNENLRRKLNFKPIPSKKKIFTDFEGSSFLPKTVDDRTQVKKMKFPILGISDDSTEEFKTYGKFKKSEKFFPKFQEKLLPITRFEAIVHQNSPIHLHEKINGLEFDSNLSRFKYLDELNRVSESIYEKYGLDFCQVNVVEANGQLYLDSISTPAKLSPAQSVALYEAAYEHHYKSKLPVWFKTQLFERTVRPFYEKRYYDSLLIKPKNSIDFKKYVPK